METPRVPNKREFVDEIEAYPTSEALLLLIESNRTSRESIWTTSEHVEIDEAYIPSVISEGRYFGARSDISNIRATVDEFFPQEGSPGWEYRMSFVVQSHFEYSIYATSERDGATIETEDPHGNTSILHIDKIALFHFLLTLRLAFQKEQTLSASTISELAQSCEQSRLNEVILKTITSMSEISGMSQSITESVLDRDNPDRLIHIRRTEKTSPRTDSCDIEIQIISSTADDDISERSVIYVGATTSSDIKDSPSSYAEHAKIGISVGDYDDALNQGKLFGIPTIPLISLERILAHNDKFGEIAEYCSNILGEYIGPRNTSTTILDISNVRETDLPVVRPDETED